MFLVTSVIALVCALIAPPAPLVRNVRIVLVEPPGEAYSPARAAQARLGVDSAVAFWDSYAALSITGTTILTLTDATTFSDLTWSLPMLAPGGPVTIFVLDNSVSNARLSGGGVGDAQEYFRAIWACQFGDVLAPLIAHELGHVLFDLPDLYYTPDACTHPDIMCDHVAAFQRGFIGCQSLAFIGTPCHEVYIP